MKVLSQFPKETLFDCYLHEESGTWVVHADDGFVDVTHGVFVRLSNEMLRQAQFKPQIDISKKFKAHTIRYRDRVAMCFTKVLGDRVTKKQFILDTKTKRTFPNHADWIFRLIAEEKPNKVVEIEGKKVLELGVEYRYNLETCQIMPVISQPPLTESIRLPPLS